MARQVGQCGAYAVLPRVEVLAVEVDANVPAEISGQRGGSRHVDLLLGNGSDDEYPSSGQRVDGPGHPANEHVLVLRIARRGRLVVCDVPVRYHGGAEAASFGGAGPSPDDDDRCDRRVGMDVVDTGVDERLARRAMLGRIAGLADAHEGIAPAVRQGDAGPSMLGGGGLDRGKQRATDT